MNWNEIFYAGHIPSGDDIRGYLGEAKSSWEYIQAVKLMEDLPTIEMRTNGSALGSNLKGHFRTTERVQ